MHIGTMSIFMRVSVAVMIASESVVRRDVSKTKKASAESTTTLATGEQIVFVLPRARPVSGDSVGREGFRVHTVRAVSLGTTVRKLILTCRDRYEILESDRDNTHNRSCEISRVPDRFLQYDRI